nr:integrase, catalytic region, zinc finger, CCHC-type, peptidase aspartic, catalytic [Tanacetum cinerariifolium]
MSKFKCYNCKKEGHFAKDCKKVKVKDYEYYKTKMLLEKKDKDEQVLLTEDQAWMESSSDSDQEINANMVFMAQTEKVLSNSEASSLSADDKISKDLQDKYDVLKNQAITFEMKNKELNEQLKVLIEKNNDLLAQTKVLKDQLQVKHVVIDTHVECQEKYAKLEAERYEYMIRYSAYFDNDKQHRKQIADQEVLYDKMSVQLVELDKHVRDLKNIVSEKDFKFFELEECVRNKDLEIEKCLERLNVCENKLHKMGQIIQTIHMIMPSKDTLYNGRKGIGFENPSYFEKAKDLRSSLYDKKVIGLGYTPMFLTHSDKALEIEKFKRARENKIEFAYDYGSLNASYVNEKINFLDDYFQEIINLDFDKIDSPFQQTSSLKPYVLTVIFKKIIIDLEDEVVNLLEKKVNLETNESLKSKSFESSENAIFKLENQSENDCQVVEKECDNVKNPKVIAPGMFKLSVSLIIVTKTSCASNGVKKEGSSNTSNDDLSSVNHLKLNKDVKRYSHKDLLSCNNSHLGETSSAYVCNDAMNVSCNSRLCDSFDENNLFIFDDKSARIYPVSKMPFRKKPHDSINIIDSGCSKHMTDNLALLTNFVEKFLGTVSFGNNDFAVIADYGDMVIGSMTIKKVYYVEGLGHNLFSVRQFCDKGLEVAFRKSTCFVRNEDGVDLLTSFRSSNLYTISLNEVASNLRLVLLKRLLLRNLGCGINDVGKLKAKGDIGVFVGYSKESAAFRIYNKRTHKIHKSVDVNFDTLLVVLEDLSIAVLLRRKKGSSNTSNVDLYSISYSKLNKDVKRYSRKHLLSCNNSRLGETSSAYVCNDAMNVSCNSRFCNSFDENNLFIFDDESVRISPVSKMFFRKKPSDSMNIVQICLWIIDSGCSKHMTGNRALLTNFMEKFLGTVRFGNNDFVVIAGYGDVGLEVAFQKSTCFVRNEDGVDLLTGDRSKLKAKRDIGVFVGYSKESASFRIYNKRTRMIHESVHVNCDEILEMASKQFSLEPGLSNLNETGKSSNPPVSQVSETSKKDLKDLFQKNFDEYFDSSKIMKSSTMNVETSNVEIPSHEEEVFHESSESFQEESSSSSLNDDVQQSPKEVILPQTNTQSSSNNVIPNVDEASTSHNVFN